MTICKSCENPTVGKSSYCSTHRAEAREAWKAKIADESVARDARKAGHAKLWAKASEAAGQAWYNATVRTMVVSDGTQEWVVPEGMCGFASLIVKPANSSFALWLKANVRTNKHYGGGLAVGSSTLVADDLMSQSYERKVAAIRAAVSVLRAEGINCGMWDRLD
jgi:hypothetical protein